MVDYYIDYSKGADTAPAVNPNWGQKFSGTIDSSADTTHFVDAALTVPAGIVNDSYNGAFFYNVTRSLSAYVGDYDDASTTITLDSAIAGMSAGDEYYLLMSYKTLTNYTSTTARTAGDNAYVRAGTTETLAAGLAFDEDGTHLLPISIIGTADGTTNLESALGITAWQDGATARPIIDANNAAISWIFTGDDFWSLKNLDIRNSNTSNGNVQITIGLGLEFTNCIFRDNGNTTGSGVRIDGPCQGITFTSCQFTNNKGKNAYVTDATGASTIKFISCTFDSGANNTPYGMQCDSGIVYLESCTFGNATAHATAEFRFTAGAYKTVIYTRNCVFNSTLTSYSGANYGSVIYFEDTDGVYGAQQVTKYMGSLTKSTAVTMVGGSDSVAKILLSTNINKYPFTMSGQDYLPDFRIWSSTTPSTISIYVRCYSSWATYPTTVELYTQAEYVSSSSGMRAYSYSSDVISSTETWVALKTAVAPAVPGFTNIKLFHSAASSSGGIYVDLKPVIS